MSLSKYFIMCFNFFVQIWLFKIFNSFNSSEVCFLYCVSCWFYVYNFFLNSYSVALASFTLSLRLLSSMKFMEMIWFLFALSVIILCGVFYTNNKLSNFCCLMIWQISHCDLNVLAIFAHFPNGFWVCFLMILKSQEVPYFGYQWPSGVQDAADLSKPLLNNRMTTSWCSIFSGK